MVTKQQILVRIAINPHFYRSLSDKHRADYDIATCAISKLPTNYLYLPPELKLDLRIAMAAAKKDGSIYTYMPLPVKNNKKIAMAAIKSLADRPPKHRSRSIDLFSIVFSGSLWGNAEFCEKAIDILPELFLYLSEDVKHKLREKNSVKVSAMGETPSWPI